MYIQKW